MAVVADSHRELRRLLGSLLALEGIAPTLRRATRQALAGGDPERMRRVGRTVVGELLDRGELLRVAIEGRPGKSGAFCLVRGSHRLVDLASLEIETGASRAAEPAAPAVPTTPTTPAAPTAPTSPTTTTAPAAPAAPTSPTAPAAAAAP
ncbi:MAG: hypothetical protein R6X25_08645, partial [Candidatus Krumholzibacteriia bacterium]